jgi:hypothetical protein
MLLRGEMSGFEFADRLRRDDEPGEEGNDGKARVQGRVGVGARLLVDLAAASEAVESVEEARAPAEPVRTSGDARDVGRLT